MMFARLPPTPARLLLLCALFLLTASPLLTSASPVPDPAPAVAQPAKLQPRAPAPSKRMGQRKVKRVEPLKKKDYSSFLCPGGSVACPVPGTVGPIDGKSLGESLNSLADWFKIGFECVELDTELNSCGGCLALGAGQDCSDIANARATGCEGGTCQVYSCFDGYVVSPDRKECVKKGTVVPPTPVTAIGLDGAIGLDQAVLE